MKGDDELRRYHAPVWDEPIIMEMGRKGERGIIPPAVEEDIKQAVGDTESLIPTKMRRKKAPALPELSQAHVLRHYLRLSQQTLGMELDIDIGVGTCTMKYSPKVNE
jgi:glycine dehydrogenase subunit 2